MSLAAAPPKPMTAEEFLAIPDDGIDRELIDGIVREIGPTLKGPGHGMVGPKVASLLIPWIDARTPPPGELLAGRPGVLLRRDPDVLLGPDLAYISAEVLGRSAPDAPFVDGPPTLAVEILSPSDRQRDIADKIDLHLRAGAVVWEVDPRFRTVRVHRPGHLPESFNASQGIDADAYLPGLVVPVAAIFAT